MIFDAAAANKILILPGVKPLIQPLNLAFLIPVTERDPPVIAIVPYLEGM